MIAAVFFAALILLTYAGMGVAYYFGAKLIQSPQRPLWHGLAIAALNLSAAVITLYVLVQFTGSSDPMAFRKTLLQAAIIQLGLQFLFVWLIYRLRFAGTILVFVFGLIPPAVYTGLMYFVVQPYFLEAYNVPTNAMAPTLIGWHKTGTCPHCGEPLVIPQPRPVPEGPHGFTDPHRPDLPELSICRSCWRTTQVHAPETPLQSPDSFVVNKLRTPKRWDLVVFRYPNDRSVLYVKRLVGLPGETVAIRHGAIWIDGERLEFPEDIKGLHYEGSDDVDLKFLDAEFHDSWELKSDECIVLGDFSGRSQDSRFFGPVPRDDVIGVVGLRYWPPSRWKIF